MQQKSIIQIMKTINNVYDIDIYVIFNSFRKMHSTHLFLIHLCDINMPF